MTECKDADGQLLEVDQPVWAVGSECLLQYLILDIIQNPAIADSYMLHVKNVTADRLEYLNAIDVWSTPQRAIMGTYERASLRHNSRARIMQADLAHQQKAEAEMELCQHLYARFQERGGL